MVRHDGEPFSLTIPTIAGIPRVPRAPAHSRNYQREHAISSEDAIMAVVVNRFQFPIPLPAGSWESILVRRSNNTLPSG
jgi:hypothetical protein